MTFSVQNNVAIINGNSGIYDNKIANPSIRYGRNAAANHFDYLNKLSGAAAIPSQNSVTTGGNLLKSHITELNTDKFVKSNEEYLKSLPPLDFEYQYMPQEGKVDKLALLGAAFEEMGGRISMSVAELTQKLRQAVPNASARAIDINNDNNVDVSEYATTILTADMLSKNPNALDGRNVTGKINKQGLYNNIAYVMPQNETVAKQEFAKIHQAFDLANAGQDFAANNN